MVRSAIWASLGIGIDSISQDFVLSGCRSLRWLTETRAHTFVAFTEAAIG